MVLGMEKQILNIQAGDLMLIIAHLLLENMEEIPGYFGHFVETFKNVFENM